MPSPLSCSPTPRGAVGGVADGPLTLHTNSHRPLSLLSEGVHLAAAFCNQSKGEREGNPGSTNHRNHGDVPTTTGRTHTMNKIQAITLAGGAAFSAIGIFGGTLVQAQSATSTQTPSTQTAPATTDHAAERAAELNAYMTKLAANLGISVDALNAAVQKANLATIDELVANGTITAERAAEMRTRAGEAGAGFMVGGGKGGPGGDHGRGGPGGPGGMVDSASLATWLGISEDTLRTELSTQSLATVAQNHGKTRDALKAFLTAEKQADLAEAVTGGRLTQAQADQKLAEFTANLDGRIDQVGRPARGEKPAPSTTN